MRDAPDNALGAYRHGPPLAIVNHSNFSDIVDAKTYQRLKCFLMKRSWHDHASRSGYGAQGIGPGGFDRWQTLRADCDFCHSDRRHSDTGYSTSLKRRLSDAPPAPDVLDQ